MAILWLESIAKCSYTIEIVHQTLGKKKERKEITIDHKRSA